MSKKKNKREYESDFDRSKLKKTDDGKWIIPLTEPVEWGDKKITQLEMSKPKAKHLRKLSTEPNMDEMLDLVADLAGQPEGMIDELEMIDATTACEFFGSFG